MAHVALALNLSLGTLSLLVLANDIYIFVLFGDSAVLTRPESDQIKKLHRLIED